MSEYVLSILRDVVISLSSPLNQALVILAMGLCLRAHKPSKKALYRACYALAACWLYLCSQYFFSYWLIAPLENYTKPRPMSEVNSYDNSAIFVLACYYFDAPSMPKVSQWNNCSLRRLVHASLLYQRNPQPIILTGGDFNAYSDTTYASEAKQFLIRLGVPESDIIDINTGKTSEQEVQALVSANLPYSHLEVISSATHSYRLTQLLKRNDAPLFTLHPVDQKNVNPFAFSPSLPFINNLERSRAAMYEYFAILNMLLTSR